MGTFIQNIGKFKPFHPLFSHIKGEKEKASMKIQLFQQNKKILFLTIILLVSSIFNLFHQWSIKESREKLNIATMKEQKRVSTWSHKMRGSSFVNLKWTS